MKAWIALIVTGAAASTRAADIDPVSLLSQVQSKVLKSAKTIPRYVCRENIERQNFAPEYRAAACELLPKPAPSSFSNLDFLPLPSAGKRLVSSDRATFDVMLVDGTEWYSWPGGGHFETNDPGDLLGGGFAGSGDFSGFIITVFAADRVSFDFLGSCEGSSCVRYRYDVPVSVSRYEIRSPLRKVSLGYHGSFDVNPQSGDLLAMTVIPTDLAKAVRTACDLRTQMTYTQSEMNASEFTIPKSVQREYLSSDGWFASNSIQYTGCRQFSAESALTFGDVAEPKAERPGKAVAALPRAGATLELRLSSSIDSELSSAGDGLEATLVRAVPATNGRTIPAGTTVRGHLALVEKTYLPKRAVAVLMTFDNIVLDGIPTPLKLAPETKHDSQGRAIFEFSREQVVLDSSFISRWRVR